MKNLSWYNMNYNDELFFFGTSEYRNEIDVIGQLFIK